MRAIYYATANVRSPFVCLYPETGWTTRSGVVKSCHGGVKLLSRELADWEAEAVDESIRAVAYGWPSLLSMLRCEADNFGYRLVEQLIAAVRRERKNIHELTRAISAKKRSKARKKSAIAAVHLANLQQT